ncbi:unnamed protein product, partial [Didymodactylos carnosus]
KTDIINPKPLTRKPSSSLISTSFDYIRKNLTNTKASVTSSADSTLSRLSNLISDMTTGSSSDNNNNTRSFFKRKNSLTLPFLINLNDENTNINRKLFDRQRSMKSCSREKLINDDRNSNLVQLSSHYGSDFFYPNNQHEYDNINYHSRTPPPFCTCSKKPLLLADEACQYPSCDEDELEENKTKLKKKINKFHNSKISLLYRSPPSTPPLLHPPPPAQSLLFHNYSSTSSSSDISIINNFYSRSKSVPSSASSSNDRSGSFDNTLVFNDK